jgi:hypothetical protein
LVGAEYDALKTGTNSKKRPKVYRPAVSFNDHFRMHRQAAFFLVTARICRYDIKN